MNKPSLEEIFHGALERSSAAQREEFLAIACGGNEDLRRQVQGLLRAHGGTDGFLEAPLVQAPDPQAAEDPSALETGPGTRIGPYKLLQEIGEGGMGVVYMAEQEEPVRRKVALKVIKLGMDTKQVIARFEAERQALAMMEHPNIARVLDAGATSGGRPYFVMELVRGIPIHEYCDRHQLSTVQRMELFVKTCRAVQHAHQKGIIHRDIKPGNVLVTSHDGTPVVKIIDFGVAKATNQRLTERTLFTEFQQVIGTPEYMSPEQAEMSGLDVDTRTDIYSLGVLLYLLLTGTTPIDAKTLHSASYGEMTRMIREEEPPTPSTRVSKMGAQMEQLAREHACEARSLVGLMRGELDWIVMRAMAKDRTRRYDSASALADDVSRYLRQEPVLAGPPSSLYRAKKLFQRNRAMVTAAGLAVLGVLLGLGLALGGYITAKAEADRSGKISAALTNMLALTGDPGALEVNAQSLLLTAREVFGEDHVTVAATLGALGNQLRSAGDAQGARDLFAESLKTYTAAYGPDHPRVGAAQASLGVVLGQAGDGDGAIAALQEALRIESLHPASRNLSACNNRRELAKLLSNRGQYAEASRLLEEALRMIKAVAPDQHYERLQLVEEWLRMAYSNPLRGDLDPMYIDLVETAQAAFPDGHMVPALALFSRGMYLARDGRKEAGEEVLWESLAAFDELDNPPLAYMVANIDMLFQLLRGVTEPTRRRQADDLLLRFLEVAGTLWGPNEKILGQNYEASVGRLVEVERYGDALLVAEKLFAFVQHTENPKELVALSEQLTSLLWKFANGPELSEPGLQAGLRLLQALPPPEGGTLRRSLLRSMFQTHLGQSVDLTAILQDARERVDPTDQRTLDIMSALELLEERGR